MIEALLRFRPTIVCGYPSTLQQIAAAIGDRDRQRVRPRRVFCGGELLTAAARRAIEAAFGAPLFDFYGAHEFNLLASQCPAGHGYHVCDDSVLVEIVDERGRPVAAGVRGEVIATALHSYTMPFVRYRTGDLAIRGGDACACGARCSTLRRIEGRSADYLRLPGGRRVHPYAITAQLADREGAWVSQHQLVQTTPAGVLLRLRTARQAAASDLERVRAEGAAILGAGVRFEVVVVEHIPSGPSGKFRPYVALSADGAASG
jgi:phenylacetate-CoA ligase